MNIGQAVARFLWIEMYMLWDECNHASYDLWWCEGNELYCVQHWCLYLLIISIVASIESRKYTASDHKTSVYTGILQAVYTP